MAECAAVGATGLPLTSSALRGVLWDGWTTIGAVVLALVAFAALNAFSHDGLVTVGWCNRGGGIRGKAWAAEVDGRHHGHAVDLSQVSVPGGAS